MQGIMKNLNEKIFEVQNELWLAEYNATITIAEFGFGNDEVEYTFTIPYYEKKKIALKKQLNQLENLKRILSFFIKEVA